MESLQKRNMERWLFISLTVLTAVGAVRADFAFGPPQNLGLAVNSSSAEGAISVSADGLEMYFLSNRPAGLGYEDLWVSTRRDVDDPWGPPVNLGPPVNSSYRESYPSVSADGLTLYFSDYFYGPDRPGGVGGHDLWTATRTSHIDSWEEPTNMGAVINSPADEEAPTISHDGLTLIFSSERPGTRGFDDLWTCTRPTTQDPWSQPVNLGPVVNSNSYELNGELSSDGLVLFFESDRPGGLGGYDIWMTRRKSRHDSWAPPVNLGPPVNTVGEDGLGTVSADGKTLYFAGDRPGGWGSWDMWQIEILPIVDFNGDGSLDGGDLLVMAENWGTSEQLCDIGPMPWGDGIVDVEDLKILAEHLFEEVDDPTLIAHWPLDEVQGDIAYNDASDCDGTLIGGPIWQSEGGMMGGALQFDGIDDYVSTDPALYKVGDKFSVVGWIKGGAVGQVILSQKGAANWLCIDMSAGTLMTELTMAGRNGRALGSETVITDGKWHRIGFVWDGSCRRLYVDGVTVAEDTHDNLDISSNGLHFGTGENMEPGSFFSGLIDEVRIYSRAVSP
jgi:hypothetical protein